MVKSDWLDWPTVKVPRKGAADLWAYADGKVQCMSLNMTKRAVHVVLLHGEIWQATVTFTETGRAVVSQVSPCYGDAPHLFDLVSKERLIMAARELVTLH